MVKRLYLLLFFFISTVIAKGAFYSHVTIYSDDHVKFTVYLNGEKKNEEPQERVRIINLTQSYYRIKIEFQDASIPPIERKVFQLTDGHGSPVDATHIIKKDKKGEYVLRWQSQTTYPGYIEDNNPTVVIVNGGNTVVRETTTQTTAAPANGVQMNFGVPGGSISINNGTETPAQTTTTTTTYSSASTSAGSTGCEGTVLGTEDFASALGSIKGRSTDEGKLSSAKQIISSNCFTVDQVKQVLKIFTGESTKLELAKFAFDRTLDKGNYFKLNSEFKEESSIDELSKATTR